MKALYPYLVFPGTCREAMEFYRDTLKGEITVMQTVADSPLEVPPGGEDRIFNSELRAGNLCIKASDDAPTHPVKAGNNFSLFVVFSNRQQKVEVFEKLAIGGKVMFPLDDNFGMLVDQYGVQWMLVDEE